MLLSASDAEAATNSGVSGKLQALNVEGSDRAEVFHVSGQERGMAHQGRGGDQGIGYRDGMAKAQLGSQPSNPRCDGDPREQLQQLNNRSFFTRGQDRATEKLAFRDHRQVFGQLRNLALEPQLPLPTNPTLIDAAGWQTSTQQSSGTAYNARRMTMADADHGLGQSNRPFDGLELILQTLKLINHVNGFHGIALPPRSLA